MLRRTKTIVLDDDSDMLDEAAPGSARPGLRIAPEPEPDASASPVHERVNFLRSELEQAPISKGSPESLAALRAEFRRRRIDTADDLPGELPRRHGIPFSRLLLVLVALIAGGVAAFLAFNRDTPVAAPEPVTAPTIIVAPTAQVLVARRLIGIGQRLAADAVEWQSWPESALRPEFITATAAPDAITELTGAIARFEFFAGEPIRAEKLADAGAGLLAGLLASGMRGVSVAVEAAAASGGFIVPNDRVDIVLTQLTPGGSNSSNTIVSNVRVLAINARIGDAADAPETNFDAAIATLELDPAQAEVVINATTIGRLSLVLRPVLDATEPGTAAQQAANQAIRISSPFWAN